MRPFGSAGLIASTCSGWSLREPSRRCRRPRRPISYKGKTVELIISTGAGGGLDTNGRIVARHLGNHIPGNPTVVAKNMPGAGHIRAANYVFNQAPKDGTTIATFIPIFVMAQVLERSKSIQFNPAEFNWLVSTSSSNSTIYVWHTTGVKTLEDAMQREVLMGGTGVGSYNVIYPTVTNSVLGTRFKIVMGYPSTTEIAIAMERGEVQGRAGNNFNSLTSEHAEWLKDRQDQSARPGRASSAIRISRPCRCSPNSPRPTRIARSCSSSPPTS